MNILGIGRSPEFTSNNSGEDYALFMAVATRLQKSGHDVSTINENLLIDVDFEEFDLVFSMARGRAVVEELKRAEQQGVAIVGSPSLLEILPVHTNDTPDLIHVEGVAPGYYFEIIQGTCDNPAALQAFMEDQAIHLHQPVYGGKVSLSPDGSFKLVSLEEWPSFSNNRKTAAKAIASLITSR